MKFSSGRHTLAHDQLLLWWQYLFKHLFRERERSFSHSYIHPFHHRMVYIHFMPSFAHLFSRLKYTFIFFIPFYNFTSFILKIYSSRFNHDIFLSFLSLFLLIISSLILTESGSLCALIVFSLHPLLSLPSHLEILFILKSYSSVLLLSLYSSSIPLNEIPMRYFPNSFLCLSSTSLFLFWHFSSTNIFCEPFLSAKPSLKEIHIVDQRADERLFR